MSITAAQVVVHGRSRKSGAIATATRERASHRAFRQQPILDGRETHRNSCHMPSAGGNGHIRMPPLERCSVVVSDWEEWLASLLFPVRGAPPTRYVI